MSKRNWSARTLATRAGYYVREGSYRGTCDDRLGRWYIGNIDWSGFRPWGDGYPSQKAAWAAAWQDAKESRNV